MTRVLVAAVVVLGASACTAPTGKVAAAGNATSTSSPPPSTFPLSTPTLAVTPTTISPPAHVGGTVFLPAVGDDPPARVTLVKVLDPARAGDRYAVPVADGKLVGVQLRIAFGGSDPVSVDVAGDTLLEDSSGALVRPTDANIERCPAFTIGDAVSPGTPLLGCLAFQTAIDANASELTFTPNGQFGSVTAEWQIP